MAMKGKADWSLRPEQPAVLICPEVKTEEQTVQSSSETNLLTSSLQEGWFNI